MKQSGLKLVIDEKSGKIFSRAVSFLSLELSEIIMNYEILGDVIVTLYYDKDTESVRLTFCCEQLVDNEELLAELIELVDTALFEFNGPIEVKCNGMSLRCML